MSVKNSSRIIHHFTENTISGIISSLGFVTGDGSNLNMVSQSTDYTALAGDFILMNTISGQRTVFLPSAPSPGSGVDAKKVSADGNTLVVSGNGASLIDGSSTYEIGNQYQNVSVLYDGTNWHIR